MTGRPSRYQVGAERYIGAVSMKWHWSLSAQASKSTACASRRTGSMRLETLELEPPSMEVKKLVKQDRMQTVDSERLDFSASLKIPIWPHGMYWAALIDALAL